MSKSPDYKAMYLVMCRAAEQALRILIEAQQQCEELYLSAGETDGKKAPAFQQALFCGYSCLLLAGAAVGEEFLHAQRNQSDGSHNTQNLQNFFHWNDLLLLF